MNVNHLRFVMFAAAALCVSATDVAAQNGPSAEEIRASSERERNSELLRSAVLRIARRPTDSDALVDAGNAALALGDAKAALNFFIRADNLQSNDGRIKLGLATAHVRTENPFEALRLFDEAERLGISPRTLAADRALAFDLLGNFSRAQQDYALARTADASDELLIRHAISLSLSGKADEGDKLLLPLLDRNVGEAWRARAFMLAARGDFRESVKVTQGFMDPRSASSFEPYLRRMPQLTGAQQAAAIHLGHFPASNLGRDSAAIRNVATNYPPANAGAGRLIPSGKPLGQPVDTASVKPSEIFQQPSGSVAAPAGKSPAILSGVSNVAKGSFLNDVARTRILAAEKAAASLSLVASPPPFGNPAAASQPAISAAPASGRLILPRMPIAQPTIMERSVAPASTAIESTTKVVAQPTPVITSPPPTIAPATVSAAAASSSPTIAPATAPATAASSFPIKDSVPAISDFGDQPKAQEALATPKPVEFDLGAIVDSIEIPESEQRQTVTPVDLSAIKPAEAPIPAAPKQSSPVKEQYPSRNWVQIATGDAPRFKGDVRRLANKHSELFKGLEGWSSPWSKSHRLVVGPFDSLSAARKWESEFRKAGGDGFVWQSDDGTVVDKLK